MLLPKYPQMLRLKVSISIFSQLQYPIYIVPLAEQNPNTSHAAKPHDKKRYLLSKNSAFEQPLQKKSESMNFYCYPLIF